MSPHLRFVRRRVLSLICASFISILLFAQSKNVTGKVIQEQTTEPLQGVTVNVKGTTISTTTSVAGSYSISVPNNQAILVFTYVGFASQEIGVARFSGHHHNNF